MTIQEAIKQRIERFNRLWVKAVGYSFEDEVEILKKSMIMLLIKQMKEQKKSATVIIKNT